MSWPDLLLEYLLEGVLIAVQVGLLAVAIYLTLVYLRGTRASTILLGIVIGWLAAWFLAKWLRLDVIEWLLGQVPTLIALAVLIIFQPELRRAFAELGSNPQRLWGQSENVENTIAVLVESAFFLAKRRIGAVIVVQRDIGMRMFAETGVAVSAPLTAELLTTIFWKDTPLHDGAVIIKEGIIDAASCVLPLTTQQLPRELGTRHRAAIGVTEDTDAVVLVVSEERGVVSLAHKGHLLTDIDEPRLRRHLDNLLRKHQERKAARGSRLQQEFAKVRDSIATRMTPPPPPGDKPGDEPS